MALSKSKLSEESIVTRFKAGDSTGEIGAAANISRERIRQILAKHQLTAKDGGYFSQARALRRDTQSQKNTKKKQREKERKTLAYFIIDAEALAQLQANPNFPTIVRQFGAQRRYAKRNRIPWEISLVQWWQLWEQSGKWEERGKRKGCFGFARRYTDIGFTMDNVEITRQEVISHRRQESTAALIPIAEE